LITMATSTPAAPTAVTTLSTLLDALSASPDAGLTIQLPDGSTVPAHFHITEVGLVRKDFIDCGGTTRSWARCVLQVWVAGDVDHRVSAGKLAHIIGLARPRIVGDDAADLEVEVEYDVGVITQFPLVSVEPRAGAVILRLGGKHTACLAPDRCGDPTSPSTGASGCCSTPAASASVTLGVRR
jgi:hypothetical protein